MPRSPLLAALSALLVVGSTLASAATTTCLTGTAPEVADDPVEIAAVRRVYERRAENGRRSFL